MTATQKVIRIAAIAIAIALAVGIISGIVSLVGLIFGIATPATNEDVTVYEVSSNVKSLDVEVGAADFVIEESDHFGVESNLKYLTVKEKSGTLYVTEKTHTGARYDGPMLKIFVPEGFVFERLEISSGAGVLTASVLSAKRVSFEHGAGKVDIGELNAGKSVEIEGGAGEININGGVLHNLDMQIGAGKTSVTATLVGSCDIEHGVGKTNITLLGGKELYRLTLERGIGDIRVDGKSVSSSQSIGSGENHIDVEGGVGEINIFFE